MGFLAGKTGGVTVGAAVWKLDQWTLDMGGELSDVSNFTSGGYEENIDGFTGATIEASGPYDNTAMAMTKGTSYSFTLTLGTGVTIVVTARVKNIRVMTKVKDATRVSFTARSTGSFTPAIV